MHAPLRQFRAMALGLLVGAAAFAPAAHQPQPGAAALPSAPFREHHAEIREHLGHIDTMTGALLGKNPTEQAATMKFVTRFFQEHIAPHAADEERVLYPVVDRHAGGGGHRFTETMRYEHGVVAAWIAELDAIATAAEPDAAAFARRTQRLLGLLEAHFGAEEDVLLALLDAIMTPEQFRRDVIEPAGED